MRSSAACSWCLLRMTPPLSCDAYFCLSAYFRLSAYLSADVASVLGAVPEFRLPAVSKTLVLLGKGVSSELRVSGKAKSRRWQYSALIVSLFGVHLQSLLQRLGPCLLREPPAGVIELVCHHLEDSRTARDQMQVHSATTWCRRTQRRQLHCGCVSRRRVHRRSRPAHLPGLLQRDAVGLAQRAACGAGTEVKPSPLTQAHM